MFCANKNLIFFQIYFLICLYLDKLFSLFLSEKRLNERALPLSSFIHRITCYLKYSSPSNLIDHFQCFIELHHRFCSLSPKCPLPANERRPWTHWRRTHCRGCGLDVLLLALHTHSARCLILSLIDPRRLTLCSAQPLICRLCLLRRALCGRCGRCEHSAQCGAHTLAVGKDELEIALQAAWWTDEERMNDE